MPRPVRTHVFRGKRYRIQLGRPLKTEDGHCQAPTAKGKRLVVSSGLSEFRTLEVLLHEGVHATTWDAAEEAVTETAHDLASFLWRLGYRRPKSPLK